MALARAKELPNDEPRWPRRFGGLAVLVLLVILGLLSLGVGPSQTLTGHVTRLSVQQGPKGKWVGAEVRLDDKTVFVALGRASRCNVGDEIDILREPNILGDRYFAKVDPCTPPPEAAQPI